MNEFTSLRLHDLRSLEEFCVRKGRLLERRDQILNTLWYWWPPSLKRLREIDKDLDYVEQWLSMDRESVRRGLTSATSTFPMVLKNEVL